MINQSILMDRNGNHSIQFNSIANSITNINTNKQTQTQIRIRIHIRQVRLPLQIHKKVKVILHAQLNTIEHFTPYHHR